MTVKELRDILAKADDDAHVVVGHLSVTHHVETVKKVGSSMTMSYDAQKKVPVVVLDLCEETFNVDEDLDEVNYLYIDNLL